MDGFSSANPHILVIAATNRLEMVEPSLLRSGRFDLKISIPLPGKKERAEIFKCKLNGIHKISMEEPDITLALSEDLLQQLSESTEGFSGADIDNVVNEAVYLQQRNDPDNDDKSLKEEWLISAVARVKSQLIEDGDFAVNSRG